MAVGLHEFNVYFGVSIVIAVLTVLLPPCRLYILRKKSRSKLLLWSEFSFGLAWLIAIVVRVREIISMNTERQLRLVPSTAEIIVDLKYSDNQFMLWELAMQTAQMIQLWLIKLAFLLYFWNLTMHGYQQSRTMFCALWITAVTLLASFIAIMVVYFSYCQPITRNWEYKEIVKSGFCSPAGAFTPQTIWLVLTLVTDFMIIFIPILLINPIKKHLTPIERAALPVIFLIGALCIVAPLTRYFINLTRGLYSSNSEHVVQLLSLQNFHLMTILSNLELLCAALAFCVPAFRFLLSASFWTRGLDKVVPGAGRKVEKRRQGRGGVNDPELLTRERTVSGGEFVGSDETLMSVLMDGVSKSERSEV